MIATPVAGSATAERSASARAVQPVTVLLSQAGCGITSLRPEPAPPHPSSVHGRVAPAGPAASDVPPTAVTNADDAGYCTPNPWSPELAKKLAPATPKAAAS